jgi:hypothetical protein
VWIAIGLALFAVGRRPTIGAPSPPD